MKSDVINIEQGNYSMSNHSFNPFIAKKYGINESILINTFIFWTQTNAAKDKNFYEGRYWFFGTPEYFTKFFIYLTPRQIKYTIANLIKKGAILKGNFNKKGYDKTNWYSLSDTILEELNLDKSCLQPIAGLIGQNCPMDRTKLSNGSDKIVQPIPDTKAVTKQDKKLTNCKPSSSSSFIFSEILDKSILAERLERDKRSDEEFLSQVKKHVNDHSDKKFPPMQRAQAALRLLKKLKEQNIIFYVAGFEPKDSDTQTTKIIETDKQRQERQFFEYELAKERENPGYLSKALEKYPEMREKYSA